MIAASFYTQVNPLMLSKSKRGFISCKITVFYYAQLPTDTIYEFFSPDIDILTRIGYTAHGTMTQKLPGRYCKPDRVTKRNGSFIVTHFPLLTFLPELDILISEDALSAFEPLKVVAVLPLGNVSSFIFPTLETVIYSLLLQQKSSHGNTVPNTYPLSRRVVN